MSMSSSSSSSSSLSPVSSEGVDPGARRAVWEGAVPVQISLDLSEVGSNMSSTDLYTIKSSPFFVHHNVVISLFLRPYVDDGT